MHSVVKDVNGQENLMMGKQEAELLRLLVTLATINSREGEKQS